MCAILLVWEPFANNMALGQISTVLAFLIIAGFLLLERTDRQITSGLVFGLATLIKLFPGLILLYLFLRRRWRCATVMSLTVASGLLLTFVIVGANDNLYYIRYLLPEHVRLFGAFPFNISLESAVRTIFDRTGYSIPAVMAPWAVQGVTFLINGLLVLIVCLLGRRFQDYDGAENLFVAFCLTMLLISPITWAHTAIVILLPMAILLRDGLVLGQRHALLVLILLLFTFSLPERIFVRNIIDSYPPGGVPWYIAVPMKPGLFGLLMLWVTFCMRLATCRASTDIKEGLT
jgi:uncharacterized membrane protein